MSQPTERDLPALSERVKRHVTDLNIAIGAAAKAGLRVEFGIDEVQQVGDEWPTPIVRVHVSNPL